MEDKKDFAVGQGPACGIDETKRIAALDTFGRMVIAARDSSVIQWDQILDGKRKYAPWDRVQQDISGVHADHNDQIRRTLPHIIDTFMYCLLSELEGSNSVRVSVILDNCNYLDIARMSWGLPAEPAGEKGWLTRFSSQRFDQPY